MAEAQPSTTRNIGRISEIAQAAVKHGFGYFLETPPAHRPPSRGGREAVPGGHAVRSAAQHLREMLDELGPTFVKFGQLLSTRPDVVPPDIVAELRGLQDDVRPFPFEQVEQVIEAELGQPIERLFLEFDGAADRGRVDRPGAPGRAPERAAGRRQGAAPGCAAADRGRPRAPVPGRADREGTRARARLHRHARTRRRVRALHPPGARLPARGAERARPSAATSPAHPHVRVPKVYWTLLAHAGADARVPRGDAVRRHRRDRLLARGAAPPRLPDDRGVDDDDLPARVLPRRPASGEHPRPRAARLHRARRLRALRNADRRGPVEADPALHRRRERERRRRSRAGLRSSACATTARREDEFRAELRELFYRYYGASLAEIDPLQVIREAFQLIYSLNLGFPTRFVLLDKSIATLGSVGIELYPGLQRLRGGEAVRARAHARALHAAAGALAGAQGGLAAGADRLRAPVPGARLPGGDPRRPDRGRIRAQGPGRVHAQGRRRRQPPRRRAGRGGRADRVERSSGSSRPAARTSSA